MQGDVIYAVRKIQFDKNLNPSHSIILQQFQDGLGTFRHFGIDIGDGSVVHFIGDSIKFWENAIIRHTSKEEFIGNSKIFRIDCTATPKFSREEVVRRALSKVGTNYGGYSLINNNCEHFALWCATGKNTSRQVFFKKDDQDIVEKSIDRVGEPLLRFGDKIDRLFGWGDYKNRK